MKKTLETGFGLGVSASYIVSATKSKHIAIDPFIDTEWNESIGISNIKKLGLIKFLKFYKDYSHNVLPKLLNEKTKIDFAFIDGNHKYDTIFIDFYYIDLMLENKGFILLDDAWMRTTQLVASFIRTNKKTYKEIDTHYKNFILFQKINMIDNRPWHDFNEFHNERSMKKFNDFQKIGEKVWQKNKK